MGSDNEETTATTDVSAGLRSLADRHGGNWQAVAAELYAQTGKLRDQRRDDRQTIEELRSELPSKDAVVLTGKDAKRWQTYQELGDPGDLEAAQDKLRELESQNRQLRQSQLLNDAAQAAGYRPDLLRKLIGNVDLESTTQKVKTPEGDVEEQTVFVVKTDDGEKPLDSYIQQEYGDFMPVLSTEPRQATETAQTRTPVLAQPGRGNPAPKTDFVQKYLEARRTKSQ